MAVVSVNYKEFKPKSYQGVEVRYGQNKRKNFKSGNFVKDWFDYIKFCIMELSETEVHFSHSSSLDHFIMDGAPYDSAYLKDKELVYENEDGLIEFFVPTGTKPTWAELKKMCEGEKEKLMIKCKNCFTLKDSKDFYEKNQSVCKECIKIRNKLRDKKTNYASQKKWNEANMDKIREKSKKYYEENKEISRKRGREYYRKNKKRMSEYHKQYRLKNKERLNEYLKEWKKKNPEKSKKIDQKSYQTNKHKYIERQRAYFKKNYNDAKREAARKRHKAWRERNPNWKKDYQERLAIREIINEKN